MKYIYFNQCKNVKIYLNIILILRNKAGGLLATIGVLGVVYVRTIYHLYFYQCFIFSSSSSTPSITRYPNFVGSWNAGGSTMVGLHARYSHVLLEHALISGTNSLIRYMFTRYCAAGADVDTAVYSVHTTRYSKY